MSDATGDHPTHDVTDLLLRWNEGGKEALDAVMPLVAAELRRLAERQLRGERSDHTLEPTALVNECYLRLVDRRRVSWRDRAHFFAFAARTMRRILVEHARARRTQKRGSGVRALSFDERIDTPAAARDVDVLRLDEALDALADLDPRQGRLVELRFFAGLSIRETAAALEVSEITVSRDWASARAWLTRALRP